jgi:hypothetical protein
VSLLVVVVVMGAAQRASWVSSVLTWGTAVLAAACIMVIGRVGFDAVSKGSDKAQETRERSEQLQEFMDQQDETNAGSAVADTK